MNHVRNIVVLCSANLIAAIIPLALASGVDEARDAPGPADFASTEFASVGTGFVDALLDSSNPAAASGALGAAWHALDVIASATHPPVASELLSRIGHQKTNIETAALLTAEIRKPPHEGLAQAVAMSKIGAHAQSQAFRLPWPEAPMVGAEPGVLPSAALQRLLALHGTSISMEAASTIGTLDVADPPIRNALAGVISRFVALEVTARIAPLGAADILAARQVFLDSLVNLQEVLRAWPPVATTTCQPVQVPPIVSLDLSHCDNLYTEDYLLLVDAGGDDVYWNNAGGSGVKIPNDLGVLQDPCKFRAELNPPDGRVSAVSALADYGGNDRYGNLDAPRSCGANGGGYAGGFGILVDAGGSDVYVAGTHGANGGGFAGSGLEGPGSGFLLDDGDGSDHYQAGTFGVNGGSVGNGALGFLLDQGGDDEYRTVRWWPYSTVGCNGGSVGGAGMLIDSAGNDHFNATYRDIYLQGSSGNNGGGENGFGFLFDGAGDDAYITHRNGANGGSNGVRGVGFLYDGGGDDEYAAGEHGTNGGANGGIGGLIDESGDDQYTGGNEGTNGGANNHKSVGLLVDQAGDDSYEAGTWGTNGGAFSSFTPVFGVAIPTVLGARGLLWDRSGDDVYVAGDGGSNGGGSTGGAGALVDERGDDAYTAGEFGANGGGNYFGFGILYDGAGLDEYFDVGLHSCPGTDRTCVPKGFTGSVGAQVDYPHVP